MNTPIKNLESEGFVVLSYPEILRNAVSKTVASWMEFCDLPVEVKKGLPYSDNAAGVGYELKEGIGKNADKKENVDLTIEGRAWLEENASSIHNPIALAFIDNATSLVSLIKPVILDFARQAQGAFGLEGFLSEVEASEAKFFVRFIHYFGDRDPGEETASSHVDQSGFTLHLFESDPGLQCLTYDGNWINMPVSEGETVIISSMQMQLRSKGRLKALCHRVVATEKTAKSGRYSAVCFVELKHTPKRDKDKTGRLQEKAPGFNYQMPHEEFKGFFKE